MCKKFAGQLESLLDSGVKELSEAEQNYAMFRGALC